VIQREETDDIGKTHVVGDQDIALGVAKFFPPDDPEPPKRVQLEEEDSPKTSQLVSNPAVSVEEGQREGKKNE